MIAGLRQTGVAGTWSAGNRTMRAHLRQIRWPGFSSHAWAHGGLWVC
jgi:hypothetical protein